MLSSYILIISDIYHNDNHVKKQPVGSDVQLVPSSESKYNCSRAPVV